MRHSIFLKSFSVLAIFVLPLDAGAAGTYRGSSYKAIYAIVFSEPYPALPQYIIDRQQFGQSGDRDDNRVLNAGIRTLSSPEDHVAFPGGQKLFQANGICFAGEWRVHSSSPYTGLLAQGTAVRVIVRASVSLDGTLQKDKRAFGMAIKFFPTANPTEVAATRNIFVMHSLGGVRVRHVLDLPLDNAPELGSLPPFGQWRTALRLQSDFELADEKTSGLPANVGYRSISGLVEQNGELLSAPRWLRLRVAPDSPRIDRDDFRDELRLEYYPGGQLAYDIAVADGKEGAKNDASWQSIGELLLTQSITSPGCDQRLHFKHPLNQ